LKKARTRFLASKFFFGILQLYGVALRLTFQLKDDVYKNARVRLLRSYTYMEFFYGGL
jgi:hypothetical protein